MSQTTVILLRRADDEEIVATLRDDLKPADLTAIEQEWASHRARIRSELFRLGIDRRQWPQSLHWNWSTKASDLKLLASTGFVIEFEGATQGVMLTKTTPYVSMLEKGKPLVYIDYLESAPWNWNIPEFGQANEFRGVGSMLFYVAVSQSWQEGYHGRVGLHALPQAESFYAGNACCMTRIGPDPNKQNLPYYELARDEAKRHLSEGGDL
jgi:hypothetical protein